MMRTNTAVKAIGVIGICASFACVAEESREGASATRLADRRDVRITFPAANARLPFVERCYLIGSVVRGVDRITVNGAPVPVYRTGAWAASVEVEEGTNTIEIAGLLRWRDGALREDPWRTNHCFVVAARPACAASAATNATGAAAQPKTYPKLPFAGDAPRPLDPERLPHEILVVLDPGHGGRDTGALSPHGYFEKEANFLLAQEVHRALRRLGYMVACTRTHDAFVELPARPQIAHRLAADAFISLHHNAPPLSRDAAETRYASVYAWNPLGERLAKAIGASLERALGGTMKWGGTRRASYLVTRNPEIPSCLVEADFITSPAGEEAIWDPARRRLIARAIAEGFDAWCRAEPKARAAAAEERVSRAAVREPFAPLAADSGKMVK